MIILLAEDYVVHKDVVMKAILKQGGEVLRINPERLDVRLHDLT